MKKLLSPLLLALALLLTSCGDSPESLTEDMIETMEEMTAIMKDLNEGGDMESAKGELEELQTELEEIGKKMQELNKEMSDEEKKAFKEKYEERVTEAMSGLMKEGMELSMKKGEEFGPTMEGLFKGN